jgi:dTDP-glucose 4,6-dehydratase
MRTRRVSIVKSSGFSLDNPTTGHAVISPAGLKVPLYGDGLNVRGRVHVDDRCQGIQLVVEQGQSGRVYHISGDVEVSNVELTKALLEGCGARWDMVTRVEDRKGHDRRYSLDDSVVRGMGYAPQVPFSEGLKRPEGRAAA